MLYECLRTRYLDMMGVGIDLLIQPARVLLMTLKPATFRLETEILAALEAIRERDGVSVSEQVRRALKLWIADRGVKLKIERKPVLARSRSSQ
jgi:hypothetical protein